MLPIGDYERRVIIFSSRNANFRDRLTEIQLQLPSDLNRHDRTLRILASAAQKFPKGVADEGGQIPTSDPIAQREETSRHSDWRSPDPQEETCYFRSYEETKNRRHPTSSPVFPLPAPVVRRKSLTDAAASRVCQGFENNSRNFSVRGRGGGDKHPAKSLRRRREHHRIWSRSILEPNETIGVAFVVDVSIYRQDDRSVAEERAATSGRRMTALALQVQPKWDGARSEPLCSNCLGRPNRKFNLFIGAVRLRMFHFG